MMRKRQHVEATDWFGRIAVVGGMALMIWGIWRLELEVLFTKAINVCLECVGIG